MLYRETQRLRNTWYSALTIVITVGVLVLMLWGVIQQIVLDKPFGSMPSSDPALIAITLFVGLICGIVSWLMWAGRMETEIDQESVRVRFFPFHSSPVTTRWERVQEIELRKFRPLTDFGGYGIRMMHKGTAYNVSGSYALKLVLKSGNKVIVGTQQAEVLQEFLTELRTAHKSPLPEVPADQF